MKARYSIRFLFFSITLCAILCWWIALPWTTAHRFVDAVNARSYQRAAEMFAVEGTAAMLTDWQTTSDATAWVPKLSLADLAAGLLLGRHRVELTVTYLVPPDGTEQPGLFQLEASHWGIHVLHAPIDHNFRSIDAMGDE